VERLQRADRMPNILGSGDVLAMFYRAHHFQVSFKSMTPADDAPEMHFSRQAIADKNHSIRCTRDLVVILH
jgi:hypothetical protein